MSNNSVQMNLELPSISVQSQSSSKLIKISSDSTLVELSMIHHAELNLIMVFLLLDTVKKTIHHTSLSKTHGVLHGETMDTLRLVLLMLIHAVSLLMLHTQLSPQSKPLGNISSKISKILEIKLNIISITNNHHQTIFLYTLI